MAYAATPTIPPTDHSYTRMSQSKIPIRAHEELMLPEKSSLYGIDNYLMVDISSVAVMLKQEVDNPRLGS